MSDNYDIKFNSWYYEAKIRTMLKKEKEITYSDLFKKCNISRTLYNKYLMRMLSDGLIKKVKKSDLRYSFYRITEKGLNCIDEDYNIMESLRKIEKNRSSNV